MSIGMRDFGIITGGDIADEMSSRGISMTTAPPLVEIVIPPDIVPPPDAPQLPVVVIPQAPIDYHEPYIPIYPPMTVAPEDVEEIVPYREIAVPEKKGLSKGILVLIGVTAFALMALSKPPTRTAQRRPYTRRRY